ATLCSFYLCHCRSIRSCHRKRSHWRSMQGLLLRLFRHDRFKDRGNLKSLRARDSLALFFVCFPSTFQSVFLASKNQLNICYGTNACHVTSWCQIKNSKSQILHCFINLTSTRFPEKPEWEAPGKRRNAQRVLVREFGNMSANVLTPNRISLCSRSVES